MSTSTTSFDIMVSSTRSGRILKDEEMINNKKKNHGKVKNASILKGSTFTKINSSGKVGNHKGSEGKSVESSRSKDQHDRSEIKATESSVVHIGTRRSQRLEKSDQSVSAMKTKSVDVAKRTPSPCRRSERIGNHASCTPKTTVKRNISSVLREAGEQKGSDTPPSLGGKKRRMSVQNYLANFGKRGAKASVSQGHEKLDAQSLSAECSLKQNGSKEVNINGSCATKMSLADQSSCSIPDSSKLVESHPAHHKQRADDELQEKEPRTQSIRRSSSLSIFEEGGAKGNPEAVEADKCYSKRENANLADTASKVDATFINEKDRGQNSEAYNFMVDEEANKKHEKFRSDLQTNIEHETCTICKRSGTLLRCDGKGCKRNYHMSCIDPLLMKTPPGIWHCICCVRKKIEFGMYSVSEGFESIWDARTIDVSDSISGVKTEKQYLVKYLGLAHVHNRWVSENQLLAESPNLLAEFNKFYHEGKASRWKREWTVPLRLLQKRPIMPLNLEDEYIGESSSDTVFSHCYYEWFVKWTGLGYEHATWEFENASLLKSSRVHELMKYYEVRQEEARKAYDPHQVDKVSRIRENPLHKLLKLPDGIPPLLENSYLESINKLRHYWHRRKNVVLPNDPDRVVKIVLFVLALLPDIWKPILIISAPDSLLLWESEFMRLAPSTNVVVYDGNKETRDMIQDIEFYEEGGRVMFKVLISPPDAVIEDFDALECIGWEAVIVDDCQIQRICNHLERFKSLASDFRVVLFNRQEKDHVVKYCSLLSFLDSGDDQNFNCNPTENSTSLDDDIALLREQFQRYFINYCRPISSKFTEFWVPVQLSDVQLEQYCASLVAGYNTLRSGRKGNQIGASCEIVISTRKCCDHPYLVNGSLQTSLTKDVPQIEYLKIGINASGKLMLLDKILQGMKTQALRAIVLFQVIVGDVKMSIGDILDDFLCQRFGVDSYERVDSGLSMAKRQVAMQMFNNKENGRFVFLMENRACLQSIKLSFVDAVIIFSSDWNPVSDIRALQKITIDPKHGGLKVFRLYSAFTVEERILSLAKQDVILESDIKNANQGIYHRLLSWGASNLFNGLEEFHKNNPGCHSEASYQKRNMDDTAAEISSLLSIGDEIECSLISKVEQHGTSYTGSNLFGEKVEMLEEEPPHIFWPKLLDDRHPQWRYVTGSLQKSRRKVSHFDEIVHQLADEENEATKKRKKTTLDAIDPPWLPCDKRKEISSEVQGNIELSAVSEKRRPSILKSHTYHSSKEYERYKVENESSKLRASQKNIQSLLKPELAKLCELLLLPDNVKDAAGASLEYIVMNFNVSLKPKTLVEALKVSLCWWAASVCKFNVDHVESLALAQKHLRFECSEKEVESVYTKLLSMMEKFPFPTKDSLNCSKNNNLNSMAPKPAVPGQDTKNDKNSHINTLSGHQPLEELHQPAKVESTSADKNKPLGDVDIQIFQSEKNHHYSQMDRITNEQDGMVKELDSQKKPSSRVVCLASAEYSSDLHQVAAVKDLSAASSDGTLNQLGQHESTTICCSPKSADIVPNIEQEKPASLGEDRANDFSLPNVTTTSTSLPTDLVMAEVVTCDKVLSGQGVCSLQQPVVSTACAPASTDSERVATSGSMDGEELQNCAEINLVPVQHMDSLLPEHEVAPSDKMGFEEPSFVAAESRPQPECMPSIETEPTSSTPVVPAICQSTVNISSIQPGKCNEFNDLGSRPSSPPSISTDGVPSGGPDRASFYPNPMETSVVQSTDTHSGHLLTSSTVVVTSVSHELPVVHVEEYHCQASSQEICLPSTQTDNTLQAQVPVPPVQDYFLPPIGLLSNRYAPQSSMSIGENDAAAQWEQGNDARFGRILREAGVSLTQPFMVTARLPPQGLHADPLVNEMLRLHTEMELHSKSYEDKKLHLKNEFEIEMEKLLEKYRLLIQDAEVEFLEKKRMLDYLHKKVAMNQDLSMKFKSQFSDNRAAAGTSRGGLAVPTQQPRTLQLQLPRASQPQLPQRPVSSPSLTGTRPASPSIPSASLANSRTFQMSSAAPSTVSPPVPTSASTFPVQVVRHASELFSSVPSRPPFVNVQVGTGRRPAPHLQFRPPSSSQSLNSPSQSGVRSAAQLPQQPSPRIQLGQPSPGIQPRQPLPTSQLSSQVIQPRQPSPRQPSAGVQLRHPLPVPRLSSPGNQPLLLSPTPLQPLAGGQLRHPSPVPQLPSPGNQPRPVPQQPSPGMQPQQSPSVPQLSPSNLHLPADLVNLQIPVRSQPPPVRDGNGWSEHSPGSHLASVVADQSQTQVHVQSAPSGDAGGSIRRPEDASALESNVVCVSSDEES